MEALRYWRHIRAPHALPVGSGHRRTPEIRRSQGSAEWCGCVLPWARRTRGMLGVAGACCWGGAGKAHRDPLGWAPCPNMACARWRSGWVRVSGIFSALLPVVAFLSIGGLCGYVADLGLHRRTASHGIEEHGPAASLNLPETVTLDAGNRRWHGCVGLLQFNLSIREAQAAGHPMRRHV